MTPLPAPRHVDVATASAAIYDHGAHVTSWVPTGSSEVLFLSSAAVLDSDAAIRGGVPICFPWFGPGRTGAMTPAHGFARRSTWVLSHVDEMPDRVLLTFELDARDIASDDFTAPFNAVYRISVGPTLDLDLTVTNTGTETFSFEEALHAYLTVGDVEQVRIEGLGGSSYLDKVAGGAERRQVGDVEFTGETDRIYRSRAQVTVVDPVLDRRIIVTRRGSSDVVVWNPGRDKGQALSDLGDGEWRGFVCVEGANVLDAAVTLEPGQLHSMGYTLHLG